jgi:hypothetical protein
MKKLIKSEYFWIGLLIGMQMGALISAVVINLLK